MKLLNRSASSGINTVSTECVSAMGCGACVAMSCATGVWEDAVSVEMCCVTGVWEDAVSVEMCCVTRVWEDAVSEEMCCVTGVGEVVQA